VYGEFSLSDWAHARRRKSQQTFGADPRLLRARGAPVRERALARDATGVVAAASGVGDDGPAAASEALDTSEVEMELAERLFFEREGGPRITLVSDDYQSIFARRGALRDGLKQRQERAEDPYSVIPLTRSLRVPEHLRAAVKPMIERNEGRLRKALGVDVRQARIDVFGGATAQDQLRLIVARIREHLGERHAILVRIGKQMPEVTKFFRALPDLRLKAQIRGQMARRGRAEARRGAAVCRRAAQRGRSAVSRHRGRRRRFG
jgi:superfamily I DNA/RNA helicase